jgi:predicted amidohydrolase YtcJ
MEENLKSIIKAKKIYTMENFKEYVESMVIEDEKIIESGDFSYLSNKYINATITDLGDTFILPGFIDSHIHLLGTGSFLSIPDLSKCESINEIIHIGLDNLNNNDYIFGRGWNQELLVEKRMPTSNDLNKISTNIPIIFSRVCGHVLVCNDFAMKKVGVFRENGIFEENDMDIILSLIPVPNDKKIQDDIVKGMNYLNSFGITSVQSDDLSGFNEEYHEKIINIFKNLSNKNLMSVRVYEQSLFKTPNNYLKFINNGYKKNDGNHFFKLGPLKILGDGSLGARTALLNENYSDVNINGIQNHTDEELKEFYEISYKNNIDIAIHAIGDGMMEKAIDFFKDDNSNFRHTIVHAQINSPKIIEKMKKKNIGTHIQPVFLWSDFFIVKDRIGQNRIEYSYNYKTIESNGIRMGFGSDSPVEIPNVIKGIDLAVNREINGNIFLPNEKISVFNAVKYFTTDAAYFSYDEDKKGKLLPGMLADFVIIDKDIFEIDETSIKDIKILMTYIGGKRVF